MRSRCLGYIVAASLLLAQTAPPAFAQRRGATGPRGGTRAPLRRAAPRRDHSHRTARGDGRTCLRSTRISQWSTRAVRRRCSTRHRAIRAIGGRSARATRRRGLLPQLYRWGGRQYYRPAWNANRINVYGRPFVGYPGWRAYGTYGLTPGLAAYTGLAFLSAGLLIGSYAQQSRTVYVYVVNEGGQSVEYRVNSAGNVISKRVVN